jgi:hypothetical protein
MATGRTPRDPRFPPIQHLPADDSPEARRHRQMVHDLLVDLALNRRFPFGGPKPPRRFMPDIDYASIEMRIATQHGVPDVE